MSHSTAELHREPTGDEPSVLFITRKFPPAVGGMEEFSARLYESYPGRKSLVALVGGQRRLPLFLLSAVVQARKRRGSYEVIHLGDGMLAPLAGVLRLLAKTPIAITLHGQEVTRDLPGYRRVVGSALKSPHAGPVAVSAYTAKTVESIFGFTPAVVANGVNTRRFASIQRLPREARAEFGLPVDGPLLIAVGRLVRRKGIAWFINEVVPKLPEGTIFCVVGDGPDADAVRLAADSHPSVHYLGPLFDATVDRLYGLADLFVAPNIVVPGKPEGFGIAPAEAAAAGLPVLVSAVEGLVDMAAEYRIPTVTSGDATGWAEAVTNALSAPGANSTSRVRSWDDVAGDYARFFAGLIRPRT